jgi:hypothetical protein
MLNAVRADSEEWVGSWDEERSIWITRLGHVVEICRENKTTKMVNQIEVRTTPSVPGLLPRD